MVWAGITTASARQGRNTNGGALCKAFIDGLTKPERRKVKKAA